MHTNEKKKIITRRNRESELKENQTRRAKAGRCTHKKKKEREKKMEQNNEIFNLIKAGQKTETETGNPGRCPINPPSARREKDLARSKKREKERKMRINYADDHTFHPPFCLLGLRSPTG